MNVLVRFFGGLISILFRVIYSVVVEFAIKYLFERLCDAVGERNAFYICMGLIVVVLLVIFL